jgi:hypothetical protein
VQAALEKLNRDVGGLQMRFRPETHVGMSYIDIGVVAANGELRY